MTQEALRMAHKALVGLSIKHGEMTDEGMDAIAAIKEALAQEKALQALHDENERLGLYKDAYAQQEQKPVAWLLTDKNINSLQVDSIQRLIDRLKHAHHTDLCVRINGQDEWFQADWLKHMVRVTPPQPEQEPVTWGVDWGKAGDISCVSIIKRLPNGGIEVVAVEYAPYSYTNPPQRTWVGLTVNEIALINADYPLPQGFARAIEAKLKELNG